MSHVNVLSYVNEKDVQNRNNKPISSSTADGHGWKGELCKKRKADVWFEKENTIARTFVIEQLSRELNLLRRGRAMEKSAGLF